MRQEVDLKPTVRFWAYSHDEAGDLDTDFGDFELFSDALDAVLEDLSRPDGRDAGLVYRIIENTEADGGTTIWIAGPSKIIHQYCTTP